LAGGSARVVEADGPGAGGTLKSSIGDCWYVGALDKGTVDEISEEVSESGIRIFRAAASLTSLFAVARGVRRVFIMRLLFGAEEEKFAIDIELSHKYIPRSLPSIIHWIKCLHAA
jgi:hypothetical protein